MASLQEIQDEIRRLRDEVEFATRNQRITANQILTVEGLSDIINNLGTIRSGNFYAFSQGTEPTSSDTIGSFMCAVGKVFNGKSYHLGGVNLGNLTWGVNSLTGELEAGGGAVALRTLGVSVYDGSSEIGRLGNLDGFLGYSSGQYGIALGDSDAYMAFDGTDLVVVGASLNQRKALWEDTTYYVDPAGADTNDGLTALAPWLTIQHAIDIITTTLDLRNYNVTIQLADGQYDIITDIQLYAVPGTGHVVIEGNTTTPASVIVAGSTACENIFTSTQRETKYILSGIKIENETTSGNGIYVELGQIEIQDFDFGNVPGNHMEAMFNGEIRVTTGYTISGNCGNHIYSNSNGRILILTQDAITIALSSDSLNPTAFDCFAYADILSFISFKDSSLITFTGFNATGAKPYYANANSVIWTEGVALPGDTTGGTVENGGYYY